jgi:hypothetical protein
MLAALAGPLVLSTLRGSDITMYYAMPQIGWSSKRQTLIRVLLWGK